MTMTTTAAAVQEMPAPAVVAEPVTGGVEKIIAAPMVGTFYVAAHPGEEPFVHVGSEVTEDTTVCVLEAMKVFTEVPADLCGKITEVLVGDGEFVEYGQPLFKVQCK